MNELFFYGGALVAVCGGGYCLFWPAQVVMFLNGEYHRDPRKVSDRSVVITVFAGLIIAAFGVIVAFRAEEFLKDHPKLQQQSPPQPHR